MMTSADASASAPASASALAIASAPAAAHASATATAPAPATATALRIEVPGVPAPQGSKAPWGGEANVRTRPWRAAVSWAALEAMREGGCQLLAGPVRVFVEFRFARPRSHYGRGRNADVLRPSAPRLVARTPDLDKLVRAVADALSGIVYRDDAQVAELRAVKLYGTPGATIEVSAAEGPGRPQGEVCGGGL